MDVKIKSDEMHIDLVHTALHRKPDFLDSRKLFTVIDVWVISGSSPDFVYSFSWSSFLAHFQRGQQNSTSFPVHTPVLDTVGFVTPETF